VFKAMTPATQEVAQEIDGKMTKASQGVVMMQYDIGARIRSVIAEEAEYGSGAVKQLAEYLNIPGGETTLYNLRNFSETFDRDFVKETSARQMANGQHLTVKHWFQLMKVKEQKKIGTIVERVLKESISAEDLENEIRATGSGKNTRSGGRKPKVPSNPLVGLRKALTLAQTFSRYEEAAIPSVFDAIDELDAERVDDKMLTTLTETREQAVTAKKAAADMITRIDDNIKRVKEVLAQKKEAAEEAYEEEEKAEKPKAEANGKPKKKKAKKPAAAA
jgi:hypothetical protein